MQFDGNARGVTFAKQHVDDLLRGAVTEKLAEGFLVPRDTVLIDQGNEIALCIGFQSGDAEARVFGDEVCGRCMKICEVASSATGNPDLLARCIRVIENQHAATARTCSHGTEETSATRTKNDNIIVFDG